MLVLAELLHHLLAAVSCPCCKSVAMHLSTPAPRDQSRIVCRVLEVWRRRTLVLAELLRYNPDIICLQEVDEKAFQRYLEPQLAAQGAALGCGSRHMCKAVVAAAVLCARHLRAGGGCEGTPTLHEPSQLRKCYLAWPLAAVSVHWTFRSLLHRRPYLPARSLPPGHACTLL